MDTKVSPGFKCEKVKLRFPPAVSCFVINFHFKTINNLSYPYFPLNLHTDY
jgi:hypothetical protein